MTKHAQTSQAKTGFNHAGCLYSRMGRGHVGCGCYDVMQGRYAPVLPMSEERISS